MTVCGPASLLNDGTFLFFSNLSVRVAATRRARHPSIGLRSYEGFRWYRRNKLAIAKGVFASVNCSRPSNSDASGKLTSRRINRKTRFPVEAGLFASLRDTFQGLR
jgi:hypothetical protein